MTFKIVEAGTKDMEDLVGLIKELAEYEKMPQEVIIKPAQLTNDFNNGCFKSFLAKAEEQTVGFALYYNGYSTWKGKTLYLEDLYVKPAFRRHSIGAALFQKLIDTAIGQNCNRMDWQVLQWNDIALNFYNKYNAKFDPGWTNGRFYSDDLKRLTKTQG